MSQLDKNTEEKILEAAMAVFIQKGKAAARMQEIADAAGINKALLHYYYRSKDRLFESVFSIVLKQLLLPKILKLLDEENEIFELIRKFVDFYVGVLLKNPFIPLFILEEINKNPTRLSNTFLNAGIPVDRVFEKFRNAMKEGKVIDMDPRQIMVSMISLCVFPFAARNLLVPVLFGNSKTDYKEYLETQRKAAAEFIIRSIQIKN